MSHIARSITNRLSLREPQKLSLELLAEIDGRDAVEVVRAR